MNKLHSGGFTAAACLLITFGSAPRVFANCCLHYQTVTFSVPGASMTVPTSINSSGAVAGYFYSPPDHGAPNGLQLGFVRDPDGTVTGIFPTVATLPIFINDAGTVAGSWVDGNGQVHGFVGNPKVANGMVYFDPPGSNNTVVTGINSLGWVTGSFYDANGRHGFLYIGGTSYPFDFPGARWTEGLSVTSQGYIVGSYGGQDGNDHGFWFCILCSFQSFDLPAGFHGLSFLSANSSLVVAGTLYDSQGKSVGYVDDLQHGTSSTFQYAGGSATVAYGIDSSGAVVGGYFDVNGAMDAFLREPNGNLLNVDPSGSNGNAGATAINDSGVFIGTLGSLGFITFPEATLPCCIVLQP